MQKQLLIGVAIVLVIVVAATALVIMQQQKREQPQEESQILAAPPSPEPSRTPRASSTQLPSIVTPQASLPTATVTEPKTPEVAGTGSGETAPGGGEGGGDRDALRERMRSMLANMTDEERQALGSEMRRMAMEQMRENQRYSMSSDWRLMALGRNQELRLSEEQQRQIQTLREGMRPKIDAALSAIWSQSEELRNQERTLEQQNMDTTEVEAQRDALRQKEREIRQQLDAEYQASVKSLLTPEQTTAFDSIQWNRDGGQGNAGGRPRGNRGGRD